MDTNVPIVASGRASHADDMCKHTCVLRLAALMDSEALLIDDQGLILDEYVSRLGHAGKPGAGEKFVKWAFDHQAGGTVVQRVRVRRLTERGWRKFKEFPNDAQLKTFDKGDQKFVAVAVARGTRPFILNAVDSDWWHHETGLAMHNLRIEQLCPQHKPRRAGR